MQYGLIGEKLSHSFSPFIHNELNNKNYILKEIEKDNLEKFIKDKNFNAINVTIPYKENVIKYLNNITPDAISIGAVNTIVNRKGVLYGYNTDLYGFISLIKKYNIHVLNKKVIILGTGGTSKTCKYALERFGARAVIKASRNFNDINQNIYTYDEIYNNHFDANIIINTTPVGMCSAINEDNINKTPIDINRFDKLEAIVDIIYNPLNTLLIQEAKNKNIKNANGLYMLVAQAVEANNYFFDLNYDENYLEKEIDKIYNKLLKNIENIVLIGMPGSGKSVVGKKLSSVLNKELVDLDNVFYEKYGVRPGDFIRENGENEFRIKETEVLDEVSRKTNLIISTGGGVVLKDINIKMLKRNGIIYFIDRDIDNIKPTSTRPLTEDREKLKKVYEERIGLYKKFADYIIKTDEIIDNTVNKILEKYNYV